MARRSISPEIKAAALADLATGEQPAVVAERYKINPVTVRSWKQRQDISATPDATIVATQDATMQRPTEMRRQETLSELVVSNLRAKLIATQRIAEYVTRDTWLNEQTAADVAELFTALDRSAIGILDRLAGAHQRAEADSIPSGG